MSATLSYFHDVIRKRRRGVVPCLTLGGLWALSIPYGLVTRMRNACFDRRWKQIHSVPVPVVSIGNLTVGGTGKTPCVERIAKFYRERDVRVAILSRGYGSEDGVNDEAMVLEDNLPDVPHLQGPDRFSLAQIAVEELDSEILILDDGFQHRRLARNLDVVLIDCTDPWGQGYVLPRGLMRESPRSLRRADVIILTRCDQVNEAEREGIKKKITSWAPDMPIVETVHAPRELVNSERASASLESIKNHPIAGFCGIGNPDAFRRTLTDLGADLSAFRSFADHHNYTREDVEDLRRWAREQPEDCRLITTQKDLVKLRIAELANRPLWALRIELQGGDYEQDMDVLAQRLQSLIE